MKQSELTIENAELLSKLKFEFQSSYSNSAERWDKAIYEGIDLYICSFTRRKAGSWGRGKNTYFIGKEKKEYKDVNEFLNTVRKRTSMKVA